MFIINPLTKCIFFCFGTTLDNSMPSWKRTALGPRVRCCASVSTGPPRQWPDSAMSRSGFDAEERAGREGAGAGVCEGTTGTAAGRRGGRDELPEAISSRIAHGTYPGTSPPAAPNKNACCVGARAPRRGPVCVWRTTKNCARAARNWKGIKLQAPPPEACAPYAMCVSVAYRATKMATYV